MRRVALEPERPRDSGGWQLPRGICAQIEINELVAFLLLRILLANKLALLPLPRPAPFGERYLHNSCIDPAAKNGFSVDC